MTCKECVFGYAGNPKECHNIESEYNGIEVSENWVCKNFAEIIPSKIEGATVIYEN